MKSARQAYEKEQELNVRLRLTKYHNALRDENTLKSPTLLRQDNETMELERIDQGSTYKDRDNDIATRILQNDLDHLEGWR